MSATTDAAVYEYPEMVLVEVLGTDEFGEIDAITYQFSYVDGSREAVTPEQAIDDAHTDLAEEALDDRGFRLTALTP